MLQGNRQAAYHELDGNAEDKQGAYDGKDPLGVGITSLVAPRGMRRRARRHRRNGQGRRYHRQQTWVSGPAPANQRPAKQRKTRETEHPFDSGARSVTVTVAVRSVA